MAEALGGDTYIEFASLQQEQHLLRPALVDTAGGSYALLAATVAFECLGTLALRMSVENSSWMVVGYASYFAAFALFPRVLARIPLGVAYAVWSGSGCVLTAVASRVLFGDPVSARNVAGLALVVTGIALTVIS